jgi:hypothetical protein
VSISVEWVEYALWIRNGEQVEHTGDQCLVHCGHEGHAGLLMASLSFGDAIDSSSAWNSAYLYWQCVENKPSSLE